MPVQPIAEFSPYQQQAFGQIAGMQGMTQPYFGAAANYMAQSATPATQADIANYFNPMAGAVSANLQDIFGRQMAQATGRATQQAGGVGAERIAMAQAQIAKQQGLAAGQTFANMYQPALQAALQGKQLQAGAGYGMGQLGPAAQAAALQGTQALMGAGAQQQQLQQALLNAQYQNRLAQIAYPFQTPQYLAGITGGLSQAMGGTTTGQQTTTYPSPSPLAQGLGIGLGALGMFGGLGGFGALGSMGSAMGKGAGAPLSLAAPTMPVTGFGGMPGPMGIGQVYKKGGRVPKYADGGLSYGDIAELSGRREGALNPYASHDWETPKEDSDYWGYADGGDVEAPPPPLPYLSIPKAGGSSPIPYIPVQSQSGEVHNRLDFRTPQRPQGSAGGAGGGGGGIGGLGSALGLGEKVGSMLGGIGEGAAEFGPELAMLALASGGGVVNPYDTLRGFQEGGEADDYIPFMPVDPDVQAARNYQKRIQTSGLGGFGGRESGLMAGAKRQEQEALTRSMMPQDAFGSVASRDSGIPSVSPTGAPAYSTPPGSAAPSMKASAEAVPASRPSEDAALHNIIRRAFGYGPTGQTADSAKPSALVPIKYTSEMPVEATETNIPAIEGAIPLPQPRPKYMLPSNAGVKDKIAYGVNTLTDQGGLSPAGAAALMGNFLTESATLNPLQSHDQGTGLGIAGWRLDRRQQLIDYADKNKASPYDYRTQINFAIDDLKNNYPDLYRQLQKTNNPADAAKLVRELYENPAKDERGQPLGLNRAAQLATNIHAGNYDIGAAGREPEERTTPYPTVAGAQRYEMPRERMPYPGARESNWGQDLARSPWMALVKAGAAMASTRGPIGTAIASGLAAGAGELQSQRKMLQSEEGINQRAQQLYQQAQTHLDQYNRMTPYQQAMVAAGKNQPAQVRSAMWLVQQGIAPDLESAYTMVRSGVNEASVYGRLVAAEKKTLMDSGISEAQAEQQARATIEDRIKSKKLGAPAVQPKVSEYPSMPTSKDQLKVGQTYQTPRGPATWDGTQFQPIQ